MTLTLAKLGEAELLRRLACFAPPGQLTDDTASLAPDPRQLVVNTDVLVEDIHFSDRTTSPADVGWRAVATNLSDLAASGAVAVDGITVALVAPVQEPWCLWNTWRRRRRTVPRRIVILGIVMPL